MAFKVPERFRVRTGRLASDPGYGNNGLFFLRHRPGLVFKAIVSEGAGWEHVSVSLPNRCPTWEELCAIKDLFWDDEDCVVQYHPPKSEYISYHPYCLHLWRPIGVELPRPPKEMVGPEGSPPR